MRISLGRWFMDRRLFAPFIFSCISACLLVCLLGCGKKKDVARFNGSTITLEDYLWEKDNLPYHTRESIKTVDDKKEFVHRLITQRLLVEEAMKRGIGNDDTIRYKIESYKRNLLINELLKREFEGRTMVTEEEVKRYYEENIGQFTKEIVEASHILVKKRDDAEMIKSLLSRGEDFPELAIRFSVGPSAKTGGSLGEITRGQMMPDFEEALFALQEPGEISQIVETDFGFHIIRLDRSKVIRVQPLSEVSGKIRDLLTDKKEKEFFEGYVEDLKKKMDIEIDEEILNEMG
jgi:peptidyl-prolyl cis-trans isomerase C